MEIAFVYGGWSLANKCFDIDDLFNNPMGLTGSELSYFRIAEELGRLGHSVTLYTHYIGNPTNFSINGWKLKIKNINYLSQDAIDGKFNTVYSWNEPDIIISLPDHIFKIVNLQINGFTQCSSDINKIDLWTSPSEEHRCRILREAHQTNRRRAGNNVYLPDAKKWKIVANGCDPHIYENLFKNGIRKQKNRLIWASSPDRGLHLLLQEWNKIKIKVSDVHLKVFYRFKPWFDHFDQLTFKDAYKYPTLAEQKNRSIYIKEALSRLSGIELVDSVSRHQINKEMAEAHIMAYPCSTVSWTEGFSVSLMEACASGTIPITSDVDALGSIYGQSIPTIHDINNNMDEFRECVIRALVDVEYGNQIIEKAIALSKQYTWSSRAQQLEEVLREQNIT